jgi:hypothetical protein
MLSVREKLTTGVGHSRSVKFRASSLALSSKLFWQEERLVVIMKAMNKPMVKLIFSFFIFFLLLI